jgi:hypothetical protein
VALFRRIRQRVGDGAPSPDQAVLVHIAGPMHYGIGLGDLEDALIEAIERADVGEFDGNELGPEDATLFMYGPDADHLFAVIEPVLWRAALPAGSHATVRYGEPGAEQRRIDLR